MAPVKKPTFPQEQDNKQTHKSNNPSAECNSTLPIWVFSYYTQAKTQEMTKHVANK